MTEKEWLAELDDLRAQLRRTQDDRTKLGLELNHKRIEADEMEAALEKLHDEFETIADENNRIRDKVVEHLGADASNHDAASTEELLDRLTATRAADAELFFVRYQLLGRTHLAGPDHWNALHAQYVELLNLEGATNVEIVDAAEVMRRG